MTPIRRGAGGDGGAGEAGGDKGEMISSPPNLQPSLTASPTEYNHQPSNHQPSNHQPSNHQPSTINHQPSTINHQPSTFNPTCQPSTQPNLQPPNPIIPRAVAKSANGL